MNNPIQVCTGFYRAPRGYRARGQQAIHFEHPSYGIVPDMGGYQVIIVSYFYMKYMLWYSLEVPLQNKTYPHFLAE